MEERLFDTQEVVGSRPTVDTSGGDTGSKPVDRSQLTTFELIIVYSDRPIMDVKQCLPHRFYTPVDERIKSSPSEGEGCGLESRRGYKSPP